jgi:PIN domain nuclease of toxin-antitoxin system
MQLLLDTHIWLWSHLAPERLAKRVVSALESTANELWLSPVSTWECLLLAERGRVEIAGGDLDAWLSQIMSVRPMHEATLTHAIARESRRISLPHQDPADRFLAATAKVLDLTLVTADEHLLRSKQFAVLANR